MLADDEMASDTDSKTRLRRCLWQKQSTPARRNRDEIHEYADGWITERKGTDVPTFLKFAYIVIMAGVIGYFFIYMNGEVNHSDAARWCASLTR